MIASRTGLGQPLPPTITAHPADRALPQGVGVKFSVSATGTAPLRYQWRWEGVDVPGATNSYLSLPGIQMTNAGDYTVLVSNLAGSVTSRVALLSVGLGRIHTNALAQLPYRLFLPRHYDPGIKYPLVLFWHGAGQVGVNNLYQLTDQGQFIFLSWTNQIQHPCFFLSPQLPFVVGCSDDFAFEDQTVEILELLQTEFSLDPDRFYITGLSMGGYVSWNFVARYSQMFAAAVPMSGGWACALDSYREIRVPVWNFHAADDSAVSVQYSDDAISSMRNAGGNPIYTRFDSGGHAIWPKAYSIPVLVDWVMAQHRGAPSTNPPLVSISIPTPNPVFATTSSVLNLAGTASCELSQVSELTWANALTGTAGVVDGTNLWSATDIAIQPGETNLIVITASGSSYVSSYGGNSTFNDTLAVLRITNRPPSFTAVEPRANGWVRLYFAADPGPSYRLEVSTNLVNWVMVGMALDRGDGTFTFDDTNATQFPYRFYRTKWP